MTETENEMVKKTAKSIVNKIIEDISNRGELETNGKILIVTYKKKLRIIGLI